MAAARSVSPPISLPEQSPMSLHIEQRESEGIVRLALNSLHGVPPFAAC
jgi:hypothetical protein